MQKNPHNPDESRADRRRRMVREMSNGRTFLWIAVAFGIHFVLMVTTSIPTIVGFMRQKHIFGMQPVAIAPATSDESSKPAEPATQPATAPAKAESATPKTADVPMTDEEKRLRDLSKAGNKTAKNLTDVTKPGERPKEPAFKLNEDP